jgi:hypothetical protein
MGSIILTAFMGEVGDGGAYGQTVLPSLAKDLAFLLTSASLSVVS